MQPLSRRLPGPKVWNEHRSWPLEHVLGVSSKLYILLYTTLYIRWLCIKDVGVLIAKRYLFHKTNGTIHTQCFAKWPELSWKELWTPKILGVFNQTWPLHHDFTKFTTVLYLLEMSNPINFLLKMENNSDTSSKLCL